MLRSSSTKKWYLGSGQTSAPWRFSEAAAAAVGLNLKAAVVKAQVLGSILGEAYRKLAQHSNFLVSPHRPHTPRHKGKVENVVNLRQAELLCRREFVDVDAANLRLKAWVMETGRVRSMAQSPAPLKTLRGGERAALGACTPQPLIYVKSDCKRAQRLHIGVDDVSILRLTLCRTKWK